MGEYSDHDLIVRIDERTANLHEAFNSLRENVVTQKEFKPVRNIAYGFVGLVLTVVFIALLGTVVGIAKPAVSQTTITK